MFHGWSVQTGPICGAAGRSGNRLTRILPKNDVSAVPPGCGDTSSSSPRSSPIAAPRRLSAAISPMDLAIPRRRSSGRQAELLSSRPSRLRTGRTTMPGRKSRRSRRRALPRLRSMMARSGWSTKPCITRNRRIRQVLTNSGRSSRRSRLCCCSSAARDPLRVLAHVTPRKRRSEEPAVGVHRSTSISGENDQRLPRISPTVPCLTAGPFRTILKGHVAGRTGTRRAEVHRRPVRSSERRPRAAQGAATCAP